MEYPVIIHHEKNSAFGVTVPDIPGCFSAGDTLEEALHNTIEAIHGHLEILAEDGEDVPQATSVDNYLDEDGFIGFVDIDITPYLGVTERVNITVPKLVLKKIDDYVKKHPEYDSRSAFLTEVSLRKINS